MKIPPCSLLAVVICFPLLAQETSTFSTTADPAGEAKNPPEVTRSTSPAGTTLVAEVDVELDDSEDGVQKPKKRTSSSKKIQMDIDRANADLQRKIAGIHDSIATEFQRIGPELQRQKKIIADSATMFTRSFKGFSEIRNDPRIIPFHPLAAESVQNLKTDLKVMDRILNTALGIPRKEGWMGLAGLAGNEGSDRPEYVGGHGAIFFKHVSFRLSEPQKESVSSNTSPDTVWERERRAVHGEVSEDSDPYSNSDDVVPFDPEKLEELRRQIAGALRHGVNIRDLPSGESITVMVSGPATERTVVVPSKSTGYHKDVLVTGQNKVLAVATRQVSNTRSFRVSRSDLDRLKAGSIKPEELPIQETLLD